MTQDLIYCSGCTFTLDAGVIHHYCSLIGLHVQIGPANGETVAE